MTDHSTPDTAARYTDQGRMVTDHWARRAISYKGAIERLQAQGIDLNNVTADDLHVIDMINMGGKEAMDTLGTMAGLERGQAVLDVGSGVGGPARRMANQFDVSVWGVELSERLYQTAIRLTGLVGLQDQVQFKHASGLDLPFPDEMFDVVVLQHVAMQIAEKDRLFRECARVIKSHGCLAMYEIFAGPNETLHYPLAWATEPSMSALELFDDCATRLAGLGFQIGEFTDLSESGRQYHQRNANAAEDLLAQSGGSDRPPTASIEARLRTSRAMEHNLRTGSLCVGMVVSRKMGIS